MSDSSSGPEQQRYSAGGMATGVLLVVALLLFLAGIILFGYMLNAVGLEILFFALGLASISLSLFIPLSLIKYVDGA